MLVQRNDGNSTQSEFTDGKLTSVGTLDAADNLIGLKEIAADGSQAVYAYDPNSGNTLSKVDLDASGNVSTWTTFSYDARGDLSGSKTFDGNGVQTAQTGLAADGSTLTNVFLGGQISSSVFIDISGNFINYATGIGQALGSALGAALGGNSLATRSIAGSVVGSLGGEVGQVLATSGSFSSALTAIGLDGTTSLDQSLSLGLSNLGATGAASPIVADDVGGGLSNLLVAEAGQALGLHGFAGVAFSSIGGSVTTQLVKNLGALTAFPNGLTGSVEPQLFAGFDAGLVGSTVTSLAGAGGGFLGSQLVPANGLGGQIGGSVGSFIGGTLGSVVPIIGTLIGSFVGDILGTLFGNLFGSNAPPRDETYTSQLGSAFGITYQDAAHGGWAGEFTAYASGIDGAANDLVAATGGKLTGISGTGYEQFYRNGGDIHAKLADGLQEWLGTDPANYTNVAKDAVLSYTKTANIAGGDPIMTAAFAAASRQDKTIEAFGNDMRVASDYKTYLANTEAINLAMAASPASAFTIGWEATLLRAQELGLNQVGDAAGWAAALTTDGTTSIETVKDSNGLVVEQENFAADGSQVDYQYYLNQTVTGDGQTIKVVNGATYTINGNNDVISAGSQVKLIVNGSGNVVTVAGDGTQVAFHGAKNAIAVTNGSVSTDSDLAVSGSNVAVTGATGAQLTLNGAAFTANVSGGAINLQANGTATIRGDNNQIGAGNAAGLTINGNSNQLALSYGDTASVNGAGNVLTSAAPVSEAVLVARLYHGILGRGPDAGGSGAFTTAAQHGASLTNLAQSMLDSAEYRSRSGAPSDAQFVAALYESALGRTAGSGEIAGWVGAIATSSRAAVAVGISESPEASKHLDAGIATLEQRASATLSGQSNVATLSNSTITIGADGSATVNGSSDQISAGTNATLTVNGNADTTTAGSGSRLSLSGAGNTATVSSGTVAVAANASVTLTGASDQISAGDKAGLTINGDSHTISAGAGNAITLNGWYDTTTSGANAIIIVNGEYDKTTAGNGATLTVTSGYDISVLGNGASIWLTGLSDTTSAGSNANAMISGAHDNTTLGANSVASISGLKDITMLGIGSTATTTGAFNSTQIAHP